MIGLLPVKKNEKGEEVIDAPQSSYKPSEAVNDLTEKIRKDYQIGFEINNRPFTEFNDMSLISRMDVDQKAFNSYVQPKSDDPDEEWRWNGIRPITRNKVLSTAAHLVSGMMYPGTFAQNDQDEEDKMAAYVMGDLIEWNVNHSDYELTFLYGVIAALVNPVAYIDVNYAEVLQTIKDKNQRGELTTSEVIDQILSGFQLHNVPADEILIANPYEYYIQRQRFIIRKRYIDFDEAKGIYGKHKNFDYVRPGTKILFNTGDATFYEQFDDNIPTLCEEVIYYNRREDIEVPFVNGVYFGDDNVNANPIRHRDNKNRPKYKYVKFGAEPIDEKRFYFYKSYSAKLANDQEVADQMWRMLMDGTLMEVMAPMAVIGGELFDTNINFPGSVSNFEKDTKIERIGTGKNLMAGWEALGQIEKSMSESTQEEQRGGVSAEKGRTAYEVAKIEQNARINLGIIGRMILKMVKDIGELMVDDIVSHQTIGQVDEITAGGVRMKYRNFLLSDKSNKGKKITEKIMFDGSLIGKKMSEKEELKASYKVMEEQGGRDADTKLIKVNPMLFSRLNFLITIEPEAWMPKNKRFDELLNLEKFDRAIVSEYTDHEALTRDILLETLFKGDADKYILKDKEKIAEQMGAGMSTKKSPMGEIAKSVKRPEVAETLAS